MLHSKDTMITKGISSLSSAETKAGRKVQKPDEGTL